MAIRRTSYVAEVLPRANFPGDVGDVSCLIKPTAPSRAM